MSQQIIKLKPGKQTPPVFTGLSNITYIADGGVVDFTSQLKFGDTKSIYFDAGDANSSFKFSGTDNTILNPGSGNNIDTRFLCKLDVGNTAGKLVNAVDKIQIPAWTGPILTFDGTPKTAVWYGLYIDDLHAHGKTRPVYGTYEGPKTYRMVLIGVVINNFTCDPDPDNDPIKVYGNSIYGFKAGVGMYGKPNGKWTLSGPVSAAQQTASGDSGAFYIPSGSAEIRNVWGDGIYGYIIRNWITVLGGIPDIDQKCGIYNCVKVRGIHYGLADLRIDAGLLQSNAPIPLMGSDFEVAHIDAGDNVHDSSYVSNAIIYGVFTDDLGNKKKLTVRDSFAWNAYNNPNGGAGGSSLLKDNSSGKTVPVLKNNIDLPPGVPLPAGYLVDKIGCVPAPGSPLIGKASDGSDIGAVQTAAVPVPPIPVPPKPRTVVKAVFTYDDGTTSTLP